MPTKNTPKYIIIGDSQVTAFKLGVEHENRLDLLGGASLGAGSKFRQPFFTIRDGSMQLDPEKCHAKLWFREVGVDKIEDCKGQLIVSMGLSSFQFYNSAMWRSFGEGRRFISDALIDTIIQDHQKHVISFYKHLIENQLIRAALMAPPPEDSVNALKIMSKQKLFELERRYRQPVIDLLNDAGVQIITLPLACEDGFLKLRYLSTHQGHASDFGPLAVEALEAL